MKNMGYGKDYIYGHDHTGNFATQEYMPDEIAGTSFYHPGDNKHEHKIANRLKQWWGEKYR
jgi:putative ATPase